MKEEKNIRGSHLAVLVDAAKMVHKIGGRKIEQLDNKLLFLAAMIKKPSLIDMVAKDLEIPEDIMDRLNKVGFKFPDLEKLKALKNKNRSAFASSNAVSATLSLRKNFTPEDFKMYTKVSADLEIIQ